MAETEQVDLDRLADDGCPITEIHEPRSRSMGRVLNQYQKLLDVIKDVHSQQVSQGSLGWMDIDRVFAAAGLPILDRKIAEGENPCSGIERENRDLRLNVSALEEQKDKLLFRLDQLKTYVNLSIPTPGIPVPNPVPGS